MDVYINEIGVVVTSETPFSMRWGSQEHRLAFYDRFFTEHDWNVHELLGTLCIASSGSEDFSLKKGYLWVGYQKSIHEQLMNLIEKSDSDLYRQLRLPLVTGSFVISNTAYESHFQQLVHGFLEAEQEKLRAKVEKAIDDFVKPLYEERKHKRNRR